MNKLFPVAISILLMLGVTSWLLAPSSFNHYLYNELKTEIGNATSTSVEVGRIDTQSLTGSIYSITATDAKGMLLFHVDQVTYAIDKKSYKKPPVKITQLTLRGVEITNDPRLLAQVDESLAIYMKNIALNSVDPEFVIEKLDISFKNTQLNLESNSPVFDEGKIGRELLVELAKQILFNSKQ